MRVLIAVLVLSACGPSIPPARPASGSLDEVAWLHAAWRAEDDGNVTDEIWVPTSENAWMGLNRTSGADGHTTHHELLRLEAISSGIRYLAAPAGQAMTAFALVDSSETSARFENPRHDFPTWIDYRRGEGGSLITTIGGADSTRAAATWRFERVGDSPPLVDHGGRLCREGSRLEITLAPCHCAAELYCAGFPVEGGLDIHVALHDRSCDACEEARGSCEIPDRTIVRVNGRALELAEGCIDAGIPVLLIGG